MFCNLFRRRSQCGRNEKRFPKKSMEKYCYREFEKPIRAYEKHCPLRVWHVLTPIIPVTPIFRIFYLGSFYFLLCAHERSHDHKFAKMRSLLKSWREQKLIHPVLTIWQFANGSFHAVANMLAKCCFQHVGQLLCCYIRQLVSSLQTRLCEVA